MLPALNGNEDKAEDDKAANSNINLLLKPPIHNVLLRKIKQIVYSPISVWGNTQFIPFHSWSTYSFESMEERGAIWLSIVYSSFYQMDHILIEICGQLVSCLLDHSIILFNC